MKSFLFLFFGLLSFSYCGQKGNKNVTITIVNNTTYPVDSIRLSSYGVRTVLRDIQPGKKVETKFAMDYSDNMEGAFLMNVYPRNFSKKDTFYTFGYFRNARDIESDYTVELYGQFALQQK